MCWALASPAAWCLEEARRPRGRETSLNHDGWHARPGSAISGLATAEPRYPSPPVSEMTRFSNLTLRNALIATHDALVTALALLATFYLRFEGDELYDRLPLLLRILPYFALFSVPVCYVLNLTTTKWRFISLPDALNILRAASVLTLALLVLDYIFVTPNLSG